MCSLVSQQSANATIVDDVPIRNGTLSVKILCIICVAQSFSVSSLQDCKMNTSNVHIQFDKQVSCYFLLNSAARNKN